MTINEKVDLLLEEFRATLKRGIETGTVNAQYLAKRIQQILLAPTVPPGPCIECKGRGWNLGDCHPRETCGHCDGSGLELRLYMDQEDRVAFTPTDLRLGPAPFPLPHEVAAARFAERRSEMAKRDADLKGRVAGFPRKTTLADVHIHEAGTPAVDRPHLYRHAKHDAGGADLTYGLLCRCRPDVHFVVLVPRAGYDFLTSLFLVCCQFTTKGDIPEALSWWKDVKFYQSDLVSDGSLLYATRLPLEHESPTDWAERTWLSLLVNVRFGMFDTKEA